MPSRGVGRSGGKGGGSGALFNLKFTFLYSVSARVKGDVDYFLQHQNPVCLFCLATRTEFQCIERGSERGGLLNKCLASERLRFQFNIFPSQFYSLNCACVEELGADCLTLHL